QAPLFVSPPADVLAQVDRLFLLPPRRRDRRPHLAEPRGVARHAAALRPGLDPPAPLVGRPGRGAGLRAHDPRPTHARPRPLPHPAQPRPRRAQQGTLERPRRAGRLHELPPLPPQPAREEWPERIGPTRPGALLLGRIPL